VKSHVPDESSGVMPDSASLNPMDFRQAIHKSEKVYGVLSELFSPIVRDTITD
jgi:hypothetical protein